MSLDNLKKRINHHGGKRQTDRMIEDKKRSLDKALLYSYQSATAVLENGEEYKCLINPNVINMERDDKMLSIPFDANVKCGSTIEWKENGTHWIVYSQYLQETAYFRGLMRQCAPEALEIDGKQFWYYLKGPEEQNINWQKTNHFILNDLNYTLEIYVSNTQETNQFFQRFKKCKIKGRNFEVQAIDDLSTEGILAVYLKEDYTNKWEKPEPEDEPVIPDEPGKYEVYIEGPTTAHPYDVLNYKIYNISGGQWAINSDKVKIKVISETSTAITIEIVSGKSGEFDLSYHLGNVDRTYHVTVLSL